GWENGEGFPSIGYPDSKSAIIIAFEGSEEEVAAGGKAVIKIAQEFGGKIATEELSREHWQEFLMHWCGMRAEVGNEDVIVAYVPRTRKDEYLSKLLDDILPRHGLKTLSGERKDFDFGKHMIFATRFSIPMSDKGWEEYISAVDEASKYIASLGGTIAACHGVGLLHKQHVKNELSQEYLDLYSDIKKILDPRGIMNPGKKFPI
ncbi:MAG: hypothetical protein OEV21_05020, partial [Thermoplasmata archaeon]|nr:hypothetical protein [Thermoplasmata archaeon]